MSSAAVRYFYGFNLFEAGTTASAAYALKPALYSCYNSYCNYSKGNCAKGFSAHFKTSFQAVSGKSPAIVQANLYSSISERRGPLSPGPHLFIGFLLLRFFMRAAVRADPAASFAYSYMFFFLRTRRARSLCAVSTGTILDHMPERSCKSCSDGRCNYNARGIHA